MAKENRKVKSKGQMVAPLTNVSLFLELMERVCNRTHFIPGLAGFYGPAGYGKTMAAIFGANAHRAHYVECGASWNKKWFVRSIFLQIFGYEPPSSIPHAVEEIVKNLSQSKRPLVIDEADKLISTNSSALIDIAREIHDRSRVAIILIGEEKMHSKMLHFERSHSRMLEWRPAQPCSVSDAKTLLKFYGYEYEMQEELLKEIVNKTAGSTRRIVTNFERIKEHAIKHGLQKITIEDWDEDKIDTGLAKPRLMGKKGGAK